MRRFDYTLLFILASVSAIILGCGGAMTTQNSKTLTCRDEAKEITKNGDRCDPLGIEQLEMDVKYWQQDCDKYVLPEDKFEMSDFLASSHECSDKERMREARRNMCVGRIREMGNSECEGPMCARALKEASDLLDECRGFEFSDDTLMIGDRLIEYLERRVVEVETTKGFKDLKAECTQVGVTSSTGTADEKALVGKLLDKIKQQEKIGIKAEEGSKMEAARVEAISSCAKVLNSLAGNTISKSVEEMGKRGIQKENVIWMAYYGYVEKLYGDLKTAGAQEVFPESAARAQKALQDFAKLKDKIEKTAVQKMVSTTVRQAKNDTKKCKKLLKKAQQAEAKVASYTAKGNKNKVRAYQAKLEKTQSAILEIKVALGGVMSKDDLPESAKERIQKELTKANCVLEKIPEEFDPTPVEPAPTPVEPVPISDEFNPTPVEPAPTPVEPAPAPDEFNPTPVEPAPTPAEPVPTPEPKE